MARKARNIPVSREKLAFETFGEVIERIGGLYRTGIYIRLSKEAGGKEYSNTVENQKALLLQYVSSREDMELVEIYIDNGYSGTNFERPAFRKMMEDIKAGKINCVVVKDLSRLGRSYLESGSYIETIFPFFHTRFVAVNDHFDTLDADRDENGMTVPLKNIINEIYAKDISRKVSASLEVKKSAGCYGGGYAPYGYKKSKVQKGRYEVDPEAAQVVKFIFEMRAEGMGYCAIAKRLNETGIKSPGAYRYEKGIVRSEKAKDALWKRDVIQSMVRDEVYLGSMVRGKTHSAFCKGEKRHAAAPEQWVVVRGTHEPVITQELFARTQAVNAERAEKHAGNMALSRERRRQENIFSGKVFCGDCGGAMEYKRNGESISFYCVSYKYGGALGCRKKAVSHRKLEGLVLEAAKTYLSSFLSYRNTVQCVNSEEQVKSRVAALEKEMGACAGTLAELCQKKKELYISYKEDMLPVGEYGVLKQAYDMQAAEIGRELEKLQKEQEGLKQSYGDGWELSRLAEEYGQAKMVTKEMVVTLIERIEVYPEKKVHISFRHREQFLEMERKAQGYQAGGRS
ncbi:MAG: recombinase family protein [Lachnospiraceae bacterium]|nr:recombinase family protein [Lachnospiraceae bacterium]